MSSVGRLQGCEKFSSIFATNLLRSHEFLALEGQHGLFLVQSLQCWPIGVESGIIVVCEGLQEIEIDGNRIRSV